RAERSEGGTRRRGPSGWLPGLARALERFPGADTLGAWVGRTAGPRAAHAGAGGPFGRPGIVAPEHVRAWWCSSLYRALGGASRRDRSVLRRRTSDEGRHGDQSVSGALPERRVGCG